MSYALTTLICYTSWSPWSQTWRLGILLCQSWLSISVKKNIACPSHASAKLTIPIYLFSESLSESMDTPLWVSYAVIDIGIAQIGPLVDFAPETSFCASRPVANGFVQHRFRDPSQAHMHKIIPAFPAFFPPFFWTSPKYVWERQKQKSNGALYDVKILDMLR